MSHGALQWIISAGNPGGGRKEFYCKPILNSQSGWWHDSRGELTIQPMKVPLKIFEAYRKWQIFQQNTNIFNVLYSLHVEWRTELTIFYGLAKNRWRREIVCGYVTLARKVTHIYIGANLPAWETEERGFQELVCTACWHWLSHSSRLVGISVICRRWL